MVLMNASSKARHASSIVNQDTKGGNKKAGLPGLIGRTAGESIALHNTSQNLTLLRNPVTSTTKPSRPIGIRFFR
jgi:hypothetical protein